METKMIKSSELLRKFLNDYNRLGSRAVSCEIKEKKETLRKKQKAIYAKMMCVDKTMQFFGDVEFPEPIPFKAKEFIDFVESKVFSI